MMVSHLTCCAILHPELKELCAPNDLNQFEDDMKQYLSTIQTWLADQKAKAFGNKKGRIDLNQSEDDMKRYLSTMHSWIADQKARAFGNKKGRIDSSSAPANKRRKTNGTAHIKV